MAPLGDIRLRLLLAKEHKSKDQAFGNSELWIDESKIRVVWP